jgi:hypothetical protein
VPCHGCGNWLLLYEGDYICGKCGHISILDSVTATSISRKIVDELNGLFYQQLSKFNKQELLFRLVAERENHARKFFKEHTTLDLGRLFAHTLLIKKSIEYGDRKGKHPQNSDLIKLVKSAEKIDNLETEHLKIKACYAKVFYLDRFDESKLTSNQLLSIFRIVESEKYKHVRRSFANQDIFASEEAKDKLQQYKSEDEAYSGPKEVKSFTPEQFIEANYKVLYVIFVVWSRSKLYTDTFNFTSLAQLFNDPGKLMEFVNTFDLLAGETQTISPTEQFLQRAQTFFNISRQTAKQFLLFDESNSTIFPLFVRFKLKGLQDSVIISHRFSFLIYTFLHAFTHKKIFDKITEVKSKEFEKKTVKNGFEIIGYRYLPNITDKRNSTLEIDGLAIKNDICYVVECKGWKLRPLIDELTTKNQIIRDLKGIVKGEKYSKVGGKQSIKKKPSLISKIQYVNENSGSRNEMNTVHEIRGLIVIAHYTPISEYQGVRIISIDDIPTLL